MSGIELRNIYKDYVPGQHSVNNVSLDIKDGEFVVLVGPSGCGKSTTLRMLAGLEDITAGEILINGEVVNDTHPKDRDIAMVFQNYALYPHMTVAGNMGFGLKMKNYDKAEIDKAVKTAAATIGLTEYLDRLPKELSGGQRQRVALGRAIVRQPKAFLMDEPLSNLDAKLRVQTRAEIVQLTKQLGITTVYVTHDQVEAMTMADRIVIMESGVIQQVGTPREVYLHPRNIFVAGFMGSPAMNFVDVTITGTGIERGGKHMQIPTAIVEHLQNLGYGNREMTMGIRPENIHLSRYATEAVQQHGYTATITLPEMLGSESLLHFDMVGQPVVAKAFTMEAFAVGQEERFCIDFAYVHFFDKESGARIAIPGYGINADHHPVLEGV